MKNLLSVFLFTFIMASAQAAKFKEINEFKSYSITTSYEIMDKTMGYLSGGDYYFHLYGIKIISKKDSEKISQTIKQITFNRYSGPYSIPDDVEVKEIKSNKLHQKMINDFEFLFDYYEYQDSEYVSIGKKGIAQMHKLHKNGFRNVRYFSINHGNSFGGAVGTVIYNQRTNELLFLEAVMSE
ncbi:hypothetical protein N9N67_04670 [Bacteriovoracaceae bacterium]|nr:hypothetical protein [Bacteriovoracaceae bacterium]